MATGHTGITAPQKKKNNGGFGTLRSPVGKTTHLPKTRTMTNGGNRLPAGARITTIHRPKKRSGRKTGGRTNGIHGKTHGIPVEKNSSLLKNPSGPL